MKIRMPMLMMMTIRKLNNNWPRIPLKKFLIIAVPNAEDSFNSLRIGGVVFNLFPQLADMDVYTAVQPLIVVPEG